MFTYSNKKLKNKNTTTPVAVDSPRSEVKDNDSQITPKFQEGTNTPDKKNNTQIFKKNVENVIPRITLVHKSSSTVAITVPQKYTPNMVSEITFQNRSAFPSTDVRKHTIPLFKKSSPSAKKPRGKPFNVSEPLKLTVFPTLELLQLSTTIIPTSKPAEPRKYTVRQRIPDTVNTPSNTEHDQESGQVNQEPIQTESEKTYTFSTLAKDKLELLPLSESELRETLQEFLQKLENAENNLKSIKRKAELMRQANSRLQRKNNKLDKIREKLENENNPHAEYDMLMEVW